MTDGERVRPMPTQTWIKTSRTFEIGDKNRTNYAGNFRKICLERHHVLGGATTDDYCVRE
jgi:hypothetical protein